MAADKRDETGRDADKPTDIPLRGWKQILWRVKGEIDRDNLSIVAAGVAFYALFAVFPAITALVTLYGLVTNAADVAGQLAAVQDIMPRDAFEILRQQTVSVSKQANGTLSLGLVFSLALAVWSATKGTNAIFTALNIAYEEQEKRGFIKLTLLSLAFTVGAIVFIILALMIIAAVPAALDIFGSTGSWLETLLLVLRWVVIAVLMMGALGVVYRYGPSRANARLRWISPGAIAATVLWLIGSAAFSLYVANFASYGETFGSLGAVVILLMWFYISAYVVCLGAELNAELEHQTARDTTTGKERPIGQRSAYVADHVAQS